VSFHLKKEEGEGFKIIGIRFLIGGIVSITLAFIAKYFMLIKYLLKLTKENQEETSFLIGISPDDCVSALIDPIRTQFSSFYCSDGVVETIVEDVKFTYFIMASFVPYYGAYKYIAAVAIQNGVLGLFIIVKNYFESGASSLVKEFNKERQYVSLTNFLRIN